jgi:spermidine/putrescine ABC transporter ATP-binding subunit
LPAPALLSIERLIVRYGSTTALDSLSLDVQRGEMFVLLGGSGSGKTTLLRAIAGFVRPDHGCIALNGRDLAGLPPHRRPVNTMFQSYALFPHMSVAANIGFGLRQRGASRAETEARVAEMLELVSLSGFGARRPNQLSGGQQQRVALARSLAPRPDLLLLDEPLSALDRNLREATRNELVRLHRTLGISFILVTHDQEEALTMASRLGVMRDGRLAQVGTPAEVYERPNSRYVAEFLGAANVLSAVIRDTGAGVTQVELPGIGRVLAEGAAPAPAGSTAWLALRPERLRLLFPEGVGGDQPNRVEGVISDRAYWGETLSHTVRLANGALLRVSEPLRDGVGAGSAAIGDRVTVAWRPDACILLPP